MIKPMMDILADAQQKRDQAARWRRLARFCLDPEVLRLLGVMVAEAERDVATLECAAARETPGPASR